MGTFWVSYDLVKQKDYERLFARLRQLGAKKVLLSMWVLKGDYVCATLRDDLRQYIDSDDRLVVIESKDWGTWNALIKVSDM
jgi:hypothetical protein